MAQTPGVFNIGSGNFNNIPVPTGNNLTFFLNANDNNRLYVMNSRRVVTPVVPDPDEIPFGNDTGAVNAYVVPAFTSPVTNVAGNIFEVKISVTNTGASTLNPNGLGNLAIVSSDLNPLVGGELQADSIYLFTYNTTGPVYQLLGLAKDIAISGTLDVVAKFTPDGQHIGDSQRTDDGTDINDIATGAYNLQANETNGNIATDEQRVIGNDQVLQIGNDKTETVGNDYNQEVTNISTRTVLGTSIDDPTDNFFVSQSKNYNYEQYSDFYTVNEGTDHVTVNSDGTHDFVFGFNDACVLEYSVVGSNGGTGSTIASRRVNLESLTSTVNTVFQFVNTINQTLSENITFSPNAVTITVQGEVNTTNEFVIRWKRMTI